MLDHDPDLIAEALDEFHAAEAVSPQALGGTATIRATVARRRRTKVITFSLLGALLVAVPIAAFAAHPRGNNPPPPDVMESATPEPSQSALPLPSLQDAKFTAEQLAAANAPIPGREMGCPDKVTGTKPSRDTPMAYIDKVVYTNLDGDLAVETAATVRCALFDKADAMVAAYDMDDTGKPVFLGSVIKPVRPDEILEIEARAGGGVIATISRGNDFMTALPDPQRREFAWDGTTFKQVAGPAKFPARKPADLSVTAGTLNLGPASNGIRKGIVTVTVRNNGPNSSERLEIQHSMINGGIPTIIHTAALGVGETRTHQLQVEVPVASTETVLNISISSYVDDPVLGNNFVNVAVNRA